MKPQRTTLGSVDKRHWRILKHSEGPYHWPTVKYGSFFFLWYKVMFTIHWKLKISHLMTIWWKYLAKDKPRQKDDTIKHNCFYRSVQGLGVSCVDQVWSWTSVSATVISKIRLQHCCLHTAFTLCLPACWQRLFNTMTNTIQEVYLVPFPKALHADMCLYRLGGTRCWTSTWLSFSELGKYVGHRGEG